MASNLPKPLSVPLLHSRRCNLLVRGDLIGKTGDGGVRVGAAQLLRPDDLARRHLDERRPAQEDLGLVADEDGVVRQRGMVCAAGRRRAEDDGA